ncbi:Uncharacterised protein [Mycobacteroides abscessus subsp. abscessus]|nr:Uncharacterised protein [Mycobacteroides abscessus subsp. abscessus]
MPDSNTWPSRAEKASWLRCAGERSSRSAAAATCSAFAVVIGPTGDSGSSGLFMPGLAHASNTVSSRARAIGSRSAVNRDINCAFCRFTHRRRRRLRSFGLVSVPSGSRWASSRDPRLVISAGVNWTA